MAFVNVGALRVLPPGAVMEALVGDAAYAICNLNGELHALSGECPHAHGPLGQGHLTDARIVCPWHEWAFDCRSGANDYDPRVKLDKFAVKVRGNHIMLDPETRA